MKCFYHNDMDGRCAGSIVAAFTKNYYKEDYFEVGYSTLPPIEKVKDGEEVWFVDYSFKEDTKHVLEELLERKCDVFWIDHHTSSMKLLEKFPELNSIKGLRQESISGAALTYMYCFNVDEFKSIPYYVQLVSDYDCWQFKLPDTTYFKLGIDMVDNDALDEIWQILFFSEDMCEIDELSRVGKILKNYIDKEHTQYRESYGYESEIGGYKCFVVNRMCNSWIAGEKYNEYPLVCVWVFKGNKYKYTLYSGNPDVDCSKIAEKYGGGGHKGAAGFELDELILIRKKD